MSFSRRKFLGLGVGALAVSPLVLSRGFAQDKAALLTDLYDKAKQEGELTWYIGHWRTETAERVGAAFTSAYPGMKCNVVRATGQGLYQRLNQDMRAKVANCDVFSSTDLGQYVSLREQKALMAYKPIRLDECEPAARDFDPVLGLNGTELFTFLGATQQAAWDRLIDRHGDQPTAQRKLKERLAKELDARGTVDVLRHAGDHPLRRRTEPARPVLADEVVIAADAARGDDHRLRPQGELAGGDARTGNAAFHGGRLKDHAAHAVDGAVGGRERIDAVAETEFQLAARLRLARAALERLDDAGTGAPGNVEARHRIAVAHRVIAAALGPADLRENPEIGRASCRERV